MRLFKRKNTGFWYYSKGRGHEKSLKTKDKDEAKRLYEIIKKEHLKGRLVDLDGDKRTTLNDFKDNFFERHTDIDGDTVRAYDLAFRLFVDSIGGNTLLNRISEKQVDKFKSDCLARKCRKTSINTYLRHLRGILNKAFDWHLIERKVKIKFFRIGKRHPRVLTEAERDSLLNYAKAENFEMFRIIQFALWTGARRAEIAGLSWQNVHGNKARLIGKGNKERTIPLLPQALEAMGEVKDIGPVFVQWNDLNKYSKAFKAIARAVDIEDIHFHHLRHTAATQMIESGININYVKEMLGHSAISTTEIYAAVVQKTLEKEMQKLKY